MRKEQKTAVVENLSGTFKKATIALVSEYRGMTVAETTEVRRKLRAVRGEAFDRDSSATIRPQPPRH